MSKYALLLSLLLPPAPVRAEAVLAIAEAVEAAVANHPSVAALAADLRASEALHRQAAHRAPPETELSVGFKDTATDSGYEIDASLSFPVERPGKRASRLKIADSDVTIARAALDGLRRDIELQVRSLAFELLAASADADIAAEVAERSRAMIDLLKQRPAAGPAMVLELRVIEASLVEFQKSAREFAAQRDAACRSLNILLGREPDAPLRIEDELRVPTATYDLPTLMARADRSPDLLRQIAEARRAAFEAEAARLESKPDYNIGPYLAHEDAGDEETTLGVTVSLPLAWKSRYQGAIAAAEARGARAEAQVAATALAARSEIARLHRLYEAAVEQAGAIPAEMVQGLHDAADLADRQYRLGAIPVQLFLEMHREFLSVQLLHHNALLEALKREAELKWIADVSPGGDAP